MSDSTPAAPIATPAPADGKRESVGDDRSTGAFGTPALSHPAPAAEPPAPLLKWQEKATAFVVALGMVASAIVGFLSVLSSLLDASRDFVVRHVPWLSWASPLALLLIGLLCLIVPVIGVRRWRAATGAWLAAMLPSWASDEIAKIVTLVVLLVCLSFAIVMVVTTARLSSTSKAATSTLLEIARVHSTEYVGAFPENMSQINQLIRNTKRELTVIVDFPAYGRFSNPVEFANYRHEIQQLINGKKSVNIACYDNKVALEQTYKQFGYDTAWDDVKKVEFWTEFTKHPRYAKFVNSHGESSGMESLATKLVDAGFRLLEDWRPNQMKLVGSQFPVFVWIRDDEEAIFSFYNLGKEANEATFRTNNARLIEILKQIFSDL